MIGNFFSMFWNWLSVFVQTDIFLGASGALLCYYIFELLFHTFIRKREVIIRNK